MQEEQIRTALAVSTREYQSDQLSRKLPRPRLAVPPRGRKKRRNSCSQLTGHSISELSINLINSPESIKSVWTSLWHQ
jgi:hypothetical protein